MQVSLHSKVWLLVSAVLHCGVWSSKRGRITLLMGSNTMDLLYKDPKKTIESQAGLFNLCNCYDHTDLIWKVQLQGEKRNYKLGTTTCGSNVMKSFLNHGNSCQPCWCPGGLMQTKLTRGRRSWSCSEEQWEHKELGGTLGTGPSWRGKSLADLVRTGKSNEKRQGM